VPRRLAHEAKAGEVARLALGPLILLEAEGVVAEEVEVAEGGTRSGHHLRELLLLLVPEAVLLPALALVAGVIPVVVVVLVGGVGLLPLGAVDDEVGGVAALKAAPRKPPPLLAEHGQRAELPHQQGDLVVGDAVIPYSEKEGSKPPYVCPGCSNHTHGNNMLNRCNVVNKRVIFLT
jgi:hypothetical protein